MKKKKMEVWLGHGVEGREQRKRKVGREEEQRRGFTVQPEVTKKQGA